MKDRRTKPEDREKEQAGRCQKEHNKNSPNSPKVTKAMKYHDLLLVSIVLSFAYGWVPQYATPRTFVRLDIGQDGPGDTSSSTEMTNPCWQDFYDEDCETNFAAASFVAAKWIKKMPCGAGIEDCDMPDSLQTPETRPEGGVDDVDVMQFLGIKRPESLKASLDESEAKP